MMKTLIHYSFVIAIGAVMCGATIFAQVGKQGDLIEANHATKQQWLSLPNVTEEIAAENVTLD